MGCKNICFNLISSQLHPVINLKKYISMLKIIYMLKKSSLYIYKHNLLL